MIKLYVSEIMDRLYIAMTTNVYSVNILWYDHYGDYIVIYCPATEENTVIFKDEYKKLFYV